MCCKNDLSEGWLVRKSLCNVKKKNMQEHQLFTNFSPCDGMLCSCLFLPSLATVKGVTADSIPTGGIGGGK